METNLIKSDREYNRILENMRGVDFSGKAGAKKGRYAYLENMYRDYTAGKGGLIESVPGFRRIYSGSSINGLHLQTTADGERYVIIHDGKTMVDGESIMGLIALGLYKTFEVEFIQKEDGEKEQFMFDIEKLGITRF